jgi:RNA polymerase sigma-70 factor (ECF subfamily)
VKLLFFQNKRKSDEELIRACQAQEGKAQRELYERFSPKMLGVCRRYIQRLEIAEEMMSNGFIKVFKNLNQYQSRGSFEGWIRQIMVRECLDYIKVQKGIWLNIEDVAPANDRTDSITTDHDVNLQELLEMVDTLPQGYRTVFNLYAIEGMKHHEIATELGISENTSKTQLMKAREQLQKRYYEQYV